MSLIEESPPYSKNKVHKAGSAWRKGEPHDEDLIDQFLAHHAALIEVLLEVAEQSIAALFIPVEDVGGSVIKPDSGAYNLTARVKTRPTLLEKLRRMPTFPIENIQDVAGLRFDCDLTLSMQTKVAEAFALDFKSAGATKVEVLDIRPEPHSGYRAIHLHIFTPAGRAEFQIRTALQSKWANLYEEAADIYGRDIRYLESGATVPSAAEKAVNFLHQASDVIYRTELALDEAAKSETADPSEECPSAKPKRLGQEAYGILEQIDTLLAWEREKKLTGERGV